MAYDDDFAGLPFFAPSYDPSSWGGGSPVMYPQQPPAPQGGVDDDYVRRLIQIESSGNPAAVTGSNRGLGQFSPDLEKKYGITDWKDPDQQISAIRAHAADNAAVFKDKFDRDPTPGELYLMHQQGTAGGPALIANPDQPAWRAIRPYYKSDRMAQEAIYGNIPRGNPLGDRQPDQISSGEFANVWTSRFPSQSGAPIAGQPGAGIGAARLAQSGPVQTDAQPPAVRTPPYQPNWFERMTTQNAPFMAGLSMMPGGANAANAAAQTTHSMIAAGEYANTSQQRALRQDIWNNQLFPGGQPNRNHPLLKNAPEDIIQAAAISGPDEGLPWLQKYAFASADQQLQMRLFAQRAKQLHDAFQQRRQAEQQQQQPPAEAPQAAPTPTPPPQNPPMMPAAATPGVVLPPSRPSPAATPSPAPQQGAPPPGMTGGRPEPSPGFIPPGMPQRVPGLASKNYDIGASVFNDPTLEDMLGWDLAFGDKTGRGASNIMAQAYTRAYAPEQAYKTAFATARGKSEGERVGANAKMQPALAQMQHLEDVARTVDPKILNAATGPYMGDNQAQAVKTLLLPSKQATAVYNFNTQLHHILHGVASAMKEGGATDQAQATFAEAVGMMMKVKNNPDMFFEILHDAQNIVRATGGEMPQYLVEKYKPAAQATKGQPPVGYKIQRISPPPQAQ